MSKKITYLVNFNEFVQADMATIVVDESQCRRFLVQTKSIKYLVLTLTFCFTRLTVNRGFNSQIRRTADFSLM